MQEVSGSAIRFVRRKYSGNVLKRNQATGAVRIWQETDIAAVSHILFTGLFLPASNHPLITGNMKYIPAIAIYESWNPAEVIIPGLTASCTVRAASSMFSGFFFLCVIFVVSFRSIKRKALVIEGAAPVAMA